jgi:ABC-type Fe3+ transport system permease subunit
VSTVPVQIFTELRQSYDPAAAAISTVLLAASVVLVSLLALIPALGRRATGRSATLEAELAPRAAVAFSGVTSGEGVAARAR